MGIMYSQQIGICLLITVCVFGTANAVKCYHCESISNPACGEGFDMDMAPIYDCAKVARPRFIFGTKNSTSCVKVVKEEKGKTNIVRACFFENANAPNEQCMKDPNAPAVFKSCDLCTTDLCNASITLYGSIVSLISASALVIRSAIF